MSADPWEEGFDAWTPERRDELHDLARGLAESRGSEQELARAELEELKSLLRERAETAETYLRQVEVLRRRMLRIPEPEPAAAPGGRELAKLKEAAAAQLALAHAERARLEEREAAVHAVERELAGLRVELARERQELEALRAELATRADAPADHE
ncbi:MAG: hypothetical protein ACYDCH_10975 [Gaiellaceae bacterium]